MGILGLRKKIQWHVCTQALRQPPFVRTLLSNISMLEQTRSISRDGPFAFDDGLGPEIARKYAASVVTNLVDMSASPTSTWRLVGFGRKKLVLVDDCTIAIPYVVGLRYLSLPQSLCSTRMERREWKYPSTHAFDDVIAFARRVLKIIST